MSLNVNRTLMLAVLIALFSYASFRWVASGRLDPISYCAQAGTGAVLITGCSSGIGMRLATDLANDGYLVYATVRSNASGAKLLEQWQRRSGPGDRGVSGACSASAAGAIIPISMDVVDVKSIERAAELIRDDLHLFRDKRRFVGVVNNAAVAHILPVELLDLQKFRELMDTNLIGVAAVLKHFLPLLRESKVRSELAGVFPSSGAGSGGRVVMISSVSAYFATPMYGAYAASKAGLEALSDAARIELDAFNISVSIIETGSIKGTEMRAKNSGDNAAHRSLSTAQRNLYSLLFDSMEGLAQRIEGRVEDGPEVVVGAVRSALSDEAPSARYYTGRVKGPLLTARSLRWAAALLPDALIDKIKLAAIK